MMMTSLIMIMIKFIKYAIIIIMSGEAKGEKATACLADGAVASLRTLIVASFRASASR
jgi:hypothetical protein